ncbi:AAA family ATPase [Geomonas sp. RF6]|uniref:AAA family ATPase n=1 Tax=Geomonas sp. RF6 TaxID=2897342 RepID=UPI001E46A0C5|nr:AAA family ATPase [Geomonas sp. RF6]UFS72400.1 AAA family ATPase [Geomonas sp. RF6]
MLACSEKSAEIEGLRPLFGILGEPLPLERTGKGPRIITVTSGNAGVGKSSVVINLAAVLAREGGRVLVVDADNACTLLGKRPAHNLYHVLGGERRPREIVVQDAPGIDILPAGMGVQQYAALAPHDRGRVVAAMKEVSAGYDFFLIDTGAGISANVTSFAVHHQEILLVLTPELSSLTDAYALLKTLSARNGSMAFRIVVNKCKSVEEGDALFRKLTTITGRFLEVSVEYFGCLLTDESFAEAARHRKALCRLFPDTPPALEFARLAQKITAEGGIVGAPVPLEPQAKEWRNHELSS